MAVKISQKQLRHIAGRPELEARGGGGFLNSVDDAQKVLDAYRIGQVKILGKTFIPERSKVYLVEFQFIGSRCEQQVYDVTQSDQRIPVTSVLAV